MLCNAIEVRQQQQQARLQAGRAADCQRWVDASHESLVRMVASMHPKLSTHSESRMCAQCCGPKLTS